MLNYYYTERCQEWLTELNQLQNRLLSGKDTPERVLQIVLAHIVKKSGSHLGYIVKAKKNIVADKPYSYIVASSSFAEPQAHITDLPFYSTCAASHINIASLIGKVADSGQLIISNDYFPAPALADSFTKENDPVHLAVIPLLADEVVSAVLVLCSKEIPFEEEMLQVFQPGFSTCAAICVMETGKRDVHTDNLFSVLIQNSSDVLTILKGDGTIHYESPGFYKLFGYQESDVIGKNVFSFLHPEDTNRVIEIFTRCLSEPGISEPVEFRFASASGTYISLEAIGNNLLDNEAVRGIIINSRNITERKKIETELRNSREHLLALLNAFPQADFLLDKDYKILKMNAIAQRYIQLIWKKQAQEGDSMLDYSNPADLEVFKMDFASAYAGQTINHEREIRYSNGLNLWFEVQYLPVYNVEGQIYAVSFIAHDITARKHNEIELNKLSLVARHTDNAVIITDKNGIIEWVNEGFTRITGYSFEEAIHQQPGRLLQGPLTDPEKVKYMRECIAAGQGFKTEIINYTKKGAAYWLSISVSPVYDQQGNLSQFIAIESDITEHKELEEHKQQVEYSFHQAFNQLENYKNALDRSALISIKDMDGKLVHVNEFYCKISKYSREELIGKHYSLVHADSHSRAFYANVWEILKQGKTWRGEIKNIAKDGSSFWVDTIINPIYSENGHITRYLSIMYEITGRKKAEDKIRESEAFLKDTQQAAHIGNWEIRFQENKLIWSDEAFTIYGLDKSKGTPALEDAHRYYHPDDYAVLNREAKLATQRGGVYSVDVRLVLPDGSMKYVNIIGKPIQRPDGKVLKIRGTIMDIEERKKNELHLEKQNEELKKLNAELDSFVYSVSHNLRAPLTSILGLINIAKITADYENMNTYLSMMEKSIHKLDATIHEINDYSRNARLEINSEEIDFDKLTGDIIDHLAFMEGASGIDIQRQIDTSIPFYSDKSRLQVVFNNLLSNAIKYHDLKKPYRFIKINISIVQSAACITIEDNGSGIAPEYKEKVFNMFYRASTQSTGSGLGLYIVKESINKMKGTITVDSEPGKGSTFKIIIPQT